MTSVKFNGYTEQYVGVTKIIAEDAGGGDDEIIVASNVTTPVEFHGGAGNDSLWVKGSGLAKLFGDAGDDILVGGGGNDEIHGGDGNDKIDGGAGNNSIYGDAGDDYIKSGAGNDLIYGGDEVAEMIYERQRLYRSLTSGAYTLSFGNQQTAAIPYDANAADVQTAVQALPGVGPGAITVSGAGTQANPFVVDWTKAGDVPPLTTSTAGVTIEQVRDGLFVPHGDQIFAGSGNDLVYGGNGDDKIDGEDGNDWLEGGSGNDRLAGSAGDDVILGGDGNDDITGGLGIDTLLGEGGDDNFTWHGVNLDDKGAGLGSDGSEDFVSAARARTATSSAPAPAMTRSFWTRFRCAHICHQDASHPEHHRHFDRAGEWHQQHCYWHGSERHAGLDRVGKVLRGCRRRRGSDHGHGSRRLGGRVVQRGLGHLLRPNDDLGQHPEEG